MLSGLCGCQHNEARISSGKRGWSDARERDFQQPIVLAGLSLDEAVDQHLMLFFQGMGECGE